MAAPLQSSRGTIRLTDGIGVAAAPPPKASPNTEEILKSLAGSIDLLWEAVNTLGIRIAPILNTAGELAPRQENSEPSMSQLNSELMHFRRRIDDIRFHTNTLLEQISL